MVDRIKDKLKRNTDDLVRYVDIYGPLDQTAPQPKKAIRGRVLLVSNDPERGNDVIVVINVGKKDGVEVKYSFIVYRGSNFIGKLIVERVTDDMSAARLDPKYGTQLAVAPGDEVATRLIHVDNM